MESKKYMIWATALFGALIILVGFGVFNNAHYSRQILEQLKSTNAEISKQYIRDEQSKEIEQLQSKINDLEAKLKAKSEDLEKCEALLAQENEERQEQTDAYDEWYNSLSDEIKKIVDEREATNKMVNDLLANNSEYANYYIKITKYSQKESRTIEESKDVIAINEKMKAIENEWQKTHKE